MCASQLFTWSRELRKQMQAQGLAVPCRLAGSAAAPLFIPVVVELAVQSDAGRQASTASAAIVTRDGRAGDRWSGREDRARADKGLIAAVIHALKATR